MKILVVDDDPDLLSVIEFALQQAGFLVVKAADGESALRALEREHPDLALLDVNLPKLTGFDLAQKLRERGSIPIMMLTVRNEENDIVRALSLGADDYLTKPFSPKILIARIRALLRRVGLEAAGTVEFGGMTLRVDELTLEGLPNGTVRLTPLEARLLQLLFAHNGRTVQTERILSHVWGNRASTNRQLLKQLVHRLRNKIEPDPAERRLLRTVPNAGYVMSPLNGHEGGIPRDD